MPSYTSGAASNRVDHHKPGRYLLAVIDACEKTSQKGSEMIELKLEVIGPNIVEGEGAVIYDYLVFSESSAWKIDSFRAACGEEIVEGEEVSIEADDQVGKQIEAELEVEEYRGKKKNKVAKYIARDGNSPF